MGLDITLKLDIDTDKLKEKGAKAQYWLDSQVMTDIMPLMPMDTGSFINATLAQSQALAGSGIVIAGIGPMGRFLYGGLVMVDPDTGSPFARPGVKKVLTDRPLQFARASAVDHWFDVAKESHLSDWVKGVAKFYGGK